MKKFTYFVSRMNCDEENEVLEQYESKSSAFIRYSELSCEMVVGTSKVVRFDPSTLKQKTIHEYHKDQFIIDILNER